jgi:hypothetical protein
MSWRFMAIEHDQPRSCSSLQCTLRRTVACPLCNSIQTTLGLVAHALQNKYCVSVLLSLSSCCTYSPCDDTCPFIRSFHSSTLWSTEYSSNAWCLYSPSLLCSNPNSIGRVWAPLNIRGRWTQSRGRCHEGMKFLLSLDVWNPCPFPYSPTNLIDISLLI